MLTSKIRSNKETTRYKTNSASLKQPFHHHSLAKPRPITRTENKYQFRLCRRKNREINYPYRTENFPVIEQLLYKFSGSAQWRFAKSAFQLLIYHLHCLAGADRYKGICILSETSVRKWSPGTSTRYFIRSENATFN